MAAGEDRVGVVGKVVERVAGHEPGRRDRARWPAARGSASRPTRGPNSAWLNLTGESPRRIESEIASWSIVRATVRRGRVQSRDGSPTPVAAPTSRILRPDGHRERDYYEVLGVERDRDRRRDQARLPQARPAVAPGRQHGPGRRRSGSRRSTRPTRSCPTRSGVSATTCSGGPACGGAGGPGGRVRGLRWLLATSSMRSSAGRGCRVGPARPAAARRGPALRPADHVRGGGQGHREGDRVHGPRSAARRATAAARQPGTEPITCPQCNGRGEVRSVRQTMLGQMVNVSACPRCHGEGKIIETPLPDVPGRGPDRAQADAARHDPGRHRRGPPDPPLERGRGRAARRSARQPVRRRPRPAAPVAEARGHRALLRGGRLDRAGGARDADHGPDRRGRARRSRSSPGPSPDTEIRLRGKGVPAPAPRRASAATST